ncbi:MAG: ankyrin repeat domain-containing protein [Bacteroidota bacterium]
MAKDDLFGKIGDFLNKSTQSIKDRLTMDVTDLIRAINKNDLEDIERALNAGVDPNAMDGANRLALHLAVDNNNVAVVSLLLKSGAKVSLLDESGATPLYKAVSWENKAIVQLLLEAGAEIHQKNLDGRTPLEEAREKGYTEIEDSLIHFHQQERNKQVKEDRARHEALKEKAKQVQQERIEEEQKRQAAAKAKEERAARRAKEKLEKSVIRKYKVTEENQYASLLQAIRQNDVEAIEVLIEKSLGENRLSDQQKGQVLLEAIRQENSALVHQVLDAGADALSIVEGEDHSPLSLAVSKNAYKLVAHLLKQNEARASDLLNNPEQVISLQFVAYKDPKMLDILMSAGANPFLGGKEMPAPVVRAINKASIAILPVLARHKVDLNQQVEGKSLLEWAIHYNRLNWVVGLIAEGVETEQANNEGKTPIEIAEELGDRAAIIGALREA